MNEFTQLAGKAQATQQNDSVILKFYFIHDTPQ